MAQDFYRPGGWNAICDMCGRKKKNDELRRNWRGLYVCPEHWEERHPQDFVRAKVDRVAPEWTRPPTGDIDLGGACATVTLVAVGPAVSGQPQTFRWEARNALRTCIFVPTAEQAATFSTSGIAIGPGQTFGTFTVTWAAAGTYSLALVTASGYRSSTVTGTVTPGFVLGQSPNRFVVTAGSSVYYSDDQGLTWTQAPNPPVTPEFMVWDGTRWLIYVYASTSTTIYQSPDVVQPWTAVGVTGQSFSRGIWFDGTHYYIARAGGSLPNLRRSTDLNTWTNITGISSASLIRTFTRRAGTWLAAGDATSTGVSSDGINFNFVSFPSDGAPWTFCLPFTANGALWALFSNSFTATANFYTTTDFATFTLRTFPVAIDRGGGYPKGYASDGTRVVFPTSDGLYTSIDMVNWTRVHGAGVRYISARWNGTTWLATPWLNNIPIATSPDGINWTDQSTILTPLALKNARTEDMYN